MWPAPQVTRPLPPGFHPISPKVTQYTQGSAEGRNPKTSKPGIQAGCVKIKNNLWTAGWAPIKPDSGLIG